jgi:hypothetical protein
MVYAASDVWAGVLLYTALLRLPVQPLDNCNCSVQPEPMVMKTTSTTACADGCADSGRAIVAAEGKALQCELFEHLGTLTL